MFQRTLLGSLALPVLAIAAPVSASSYAFPIDIRAQPLSAALRDLARQTRVELLYDRNLIRGMQAPRLKGRYTVEAALGQLLAGSGLTMRRAASGAWVIERRPVAPPPRPATVDEEDPPAPEILVTGRRSQNADIRRRENDVQPYQVTTSDQIVRAHRDNVDEYFRSRVTANTQVFPPGLLNDGKTNSMIDLRGLGGTATMILVDGRRMPGGPEELDDPSQPDLNAIPLHAIERIETLTGNAAGIHGFDALGGVVNVILKRDYRGAELHVTGGVTARGDAPRLALEGRIGFTPDGGRTDVMLNVSWSHARPLLIGERDYAEKYRRQSYAFDPVWVMAASPYGNAVSVVNYSSYPPDYFAPLVFKPEYGGGALSADHSFLPLGFRGTPADLVAALTRNSGSLDLSLTDAEAASQMGSNASTLSAIASLRHDFGDGVEAFLDGIYLRNHGRNFSHSSFGDIVIFPDAPQNPFTDIIQVTFPAPAEYGVTRNVFQTMRLTAGVIVPLPSGWKGTFEVNFARTRFDRLGGTDNYYSGPILLWDGSEDPAFDPLGNWEDFQRLLATSYTKAGAHSTLRGENRYQEQSLRLAGPLFATPAGSATLTLLAQRRHDNMPPMVDGRFGTTPGAGVEYATPARAVAVQSLYGELRAPIFADSAPVSVLRDFELQVAARYDRQHLEYAGDRSDPDALRIHRRFAAVSYTAGAKFSPLPWLMLRGSYATGERPPLLADLDPLEYESGRYLLLDPKRGNAWFTDDGSYISRTNGSPNLGMVKADTLSLGAVFNPFGDNAPRLSIDYSRIDKSREAFYPDSDMILANEDLWPGRVAREPLTDADRALGYTAGPIILIDSTAMDAARVRVETLDGRLSWTVPALSGTLHVYANGTLQISNLLIEPFADPVERIPYYQAPLRWRANGGFDWSFGATSIGANLQYFDRYRIRLPGYGCCTDSGVEIQGSEWVKSQTYLDLYASRRFRLGRYEASFDLGIVNVLDQAPRREVSTAFDPSNYSLYGDPRRRRFELVLSAGF